MTVNVLGNVILVGIYAGFITKYIVSFIFTSTLNLVGLRVLRKCRNKSLNTAGSEMMRLLQMVLYCKHKYLRITVFLR